MPAQRSRGSYAKLICLNCRTRKIRCVLPDNVEIVASRQPQPEATSCQRCRSKHLVCIVDHTTLGRPSQSSATVNMRSRPEPRSRANASVHLSNDNPVMSTSAMEDVLPAGVDEYMLVRPEKTPGNETTTAPPPRPRTTPPDKFLAMISPSFLLSTLLLRYEKFASSLPPLFPLGVDETLGVLSEDAASILDQHLLWYRLYYPDVPSITILRNEWRNMETYSMDSVSVSFLLALLCSLALNVSTDAVRPYRNLQPLMDRLVFRHGQNLLSSLPWHRYTPLALELLREFKPLGMATDRITACHSISGRQYYLLARGMALDLKFDKAPAQVKELVDSQDQPINEDLLYDCLRWYRLCLADTSSAFAGQRRQHEMRQLGESCTGIIEFLETLLASHHVPFDALFAFHSILAKARTVESLMSIKDDWRSLENLSNVIETHKSASERQSAQAKEVIRTHSDTCGELALAMSRILDMELHGSYCMIAGAALFFCVMAGAQHAPSEPGPQEAVQVSDQVIARLKDPSQYANDGSPALKFLSKYGEARTDDLEQVLGNFVDCADHLRLNGQPFVPPALSSLRAVLSACKEILEGNAARMKGWGGLHGRAHVQLLLIRECAASLERIGASQTDQNHATTVANGCLWTATAQVFRSLHRLMAEWKEWNALGRAAVTSGGDGDGSRETTAAPSSEPTVATNEADLLGFDEISPDDLVFDWDLWLQDDVWNAM